MEIKEHSTANPEVVVSNPAPDSTVEMIALALYWTIRLIDINC
jgi:hypothetical protein